MDSSQSTPEDRALIRQGLGVIEAFSSWPVAEFERLLQSARVGRYARGDLVHSEALGEPEIVTVVSGHLMWSRVHVDGSRASIAIYGPGMLVGASRALNLEDDPFYECRAHDNLVVIQFPTQLLLDTLDAQAHLWKGMAQMLFRHHRAFFTTMMDQLTGSLRRRVAATVARLAQVYGVDDTTQSLRLRLSQEDLAAMLQASRGAINREMRALEELGLIRTEYGVTVIGDIDALRDLAGVAQEPVQGDSEERA